MTIGHHDQFMAMTFEHKVYTVTGGASGIGRSLSVMLVKAGAIVYACDVNEAGLVETKKKCRPFYLTEADFKALVCPGTSISRNWM
jgi:NAD(P)-dependent dehydrogenase (short-subunit alcohol dehydrogenase family)